jgi:hypothetical protein
MLFEVLTDIAAAASGVAMLATVFCLCCLAFPTDSRRSVRAAHVSAFIGLVCYGVILLMFQLTPFVL